MFSLIARHSDDLPTQVGNRVMFLVNKIKLYQYYISRIFIIDWETCMALTILICPNYYTSLIISHQIHYISYYYSFYLYIYIVIL